MSIKKWKMADNLYVFLLYFLKIVIILLILLSICYVGFTLFLFFCTFAEPKCIELRI